MSREKSRGTTLLELLVASTLLALVALAFASGFAIARDREDSASSKTLLRSSGAHALDQVAREIVDSAPGLVDTVQRGPGQTTSDQFEDPLGMNCDSPACSGLSATASGGLPVAPASTLGVALDGTPTGMAWTPFALGRSNVCPFDGASLSIGAFTDAVLFLSPHDVDSPGLAIQTRPNGASPLYASIIIYAPFVDAQGRGSLRRYTLGWREIAAQAAFVPVPANLEACLAPSGVLYQPGAPPDMGSPANCEFSLADLAHPSTIVWRKGDPGSDHAWFTFDRATGLATWDIQHEFIWTDSSGTGHDDIFTSVNLVGVARPCLPFAPDLVDFACSTSISNPAQVVDPRRVRLAIALASTRAAARQGLAYAREGQAVVSSLEANVRNSP
ncbi:MAG TPA: hypothetical protein VFF73_26565 [Planctomycetota bacterium]|nr:hypothetical protein [Planctomycetota bacterium]